MRLTASHAGSPDGSTAQSRLCGLLRHGQPCLPEYVAGIHAHLPDHSRSDSPVLVVLDYAHPLACGAWQANRYGWHRGGHYKLQASWIIPYSLTAMPLDEDSVVPANDPLE